MDCFNEGRRINGYAGKVYRTGDGYKPGHFKRRHREFIKLNVTMQTGDVIEVNTKYGSKGATLTRDGVKYDYFRKVDVDSTFMQLDIGDNNFRYDADGGVNSMEVSIFMTGNIWGV